MANPGGPLNMIGITPQFTSNLITTGVSAGVRAGTNQLFRGVANQSLAQAGSALVGNVTTNLVSVGVNSLLGSQVTGASGLSLNSGANILASTITPYLTGSLAQGLNQSLNNSLKGAGPLGPVLSQIGSGLINQGLNGLTNLLTGAATPSSGGGSKFFPGAGSEPDADYSGGNAYTLGSNGPDVVIAIRSAKSSSLAAGAADAINLPVVPTSLSLSSLTSANPIINKAVNGVKSAAMGSVGTSVLSFVGGL